MSEFKVRDRVRVKSTFHLGSTVGSISSIEDSGGRVWVRRDGTIQPIPLADDSLELIHRPGGAAASPVKHSHYFRPCPFDSIDVYRVLSIFGVTDPCLQHAVKKLLVAGGRGHKDISRDVQDAIDTLTRWQAMRAEEAA
jgi:hypothetical protein